MMKTKLQILTFFLLCHTVLFSVVENKEEEKLAYLIGQIIETKTKESIPYVDVLLKKEGEIVMETTADAEGRFQLEKVPYGKYELELSFIGFEEVSKSINIDTRKKDLGKIFLNVISNENIEEVVTVGKKSVIVNKIDRKVLELGDDIIADGANLDDAINTIPGVFVDQQNNNIQLRGNTNVRILINGKPTPLSYDQVKKQYPTNIIDKIEVITNPSAKYSPEGNSGIINFIIKKQKMKGRNISLATNYRYGDIGKYSNSINFNHNTGTVNIFGNVGYDDHKGKNHGNLSLPNQNRNQLLSIDSRDISKNLKLGMDWYIDERNTFSVYGNYLRDDYEFSLNDDLYSLDKGILQINNRTEEDENEDFQEYNMNYEHKFLKDGHKIEIETMYNLNQSDNDRTMKISNQEDSFVEINSDNGQFLLNIDYENPIGEHVKLEFGSSIRLTNYEQDYINGEVNNTYNFDRDIYAAYGELSHELNRFSYKVGVRAEQVEIETAYTEEGVDLYDRDYFEIYPTVHVAYKLGKEEKTELMANYSRRVDRPSKGMLSPIADVASSSSEIVGNPFLTPQFTNSFELGVSRTLEKGYVGLTGFYRKIDDKFNQQFNYSEEDGIIRIQNINANSVSNYGAELSFNYNPTKWWSIYSGAEYYFAELEGSVYFDPETNLDEIVNVDNNSFFLRMNNSIKVDKTLSFSLFGFYKSEQKTLQGKFGDLWKIDVGARKILLDNKLSVSVRLQDVFNRMHAEWDNTRPERFPQTGEWHWENQQLFVGVKYNFKSGKVKSRNRKDREDSEASGGGFGL